MWMMMSMATTAAAATTEELPYNPRNRVLEKDDLDSFLTPYGVTMKPLDINIYRKAFVNKSYCTRKNENFINGNEKCPAGCIPLQEESNERLEFLGDSVLNLVVAKYLWKRYPREAEGFLTKMRTKLVNGQMLAQLSKSVGFDRFVIIAQQIEANGGRENSNILEDTFEAFIAAVFLDFDEKKLVKKKGVAADGDANAASTSTSAAAAAAMDMSGLGFQVAERWIIGVLETWVDFPELVRSNQNYKDQLIKFYQHTRHAVPKFVDVDAGGTLAAAATTSKAFTVCVKDERDAVMGVGTADTKKKAEQMASCNALRYLGVQVD
jgi:dsRNA-specific ribonuclease